MAGRAPASAERATDDARRLSAELARRLGVPGGLLPAFEDPWPHVQGEAALPLDVDPLSADLEDPEERRRLARVLGRGLAREAGQVLPLAREEGRWMHRAAGSSGEAGSSSCRATRPSGCAFRSPPSRASPAR